MNDINFHFSPDIEACFVGHFEVLAGCEVYTLLLYLFVVPQMFAYQHERRVGSGPCVDLSSQAERRYHSQFNTSSAPKYIFRKKLIVSL